MLEGFSFTALTTFHGSDLSELSKFKAPLSKHHPTSLKLTY